MFIAFAALASKPGLGLRKASVFSSAPLRRCGKRTLPISLVAVFDRSEWLPAFRSFSALSESLLFDAEPANLGAALKGFTGTFPTNAGVFMTTHWSVVAELPLERRNSAPERAQQALTQLCQDYWPPLYRFVRQRGYSRADAEDLTQGFFAYLLEKRAYATFDRSKGRFRTFLLVLLKRYLGASQAHQRRQKRGGDKEMIFLDAERLDAAEQFDDNALSTAAPLDEESVFEWNWSVALVGRAMEELKAEYASGQKARVFATLRPFLTGGVGLPTYEEAAARLGVPIETLRSYLFRFRSRYRSLLRAEVARTVPTCQDVETELRYLCRVLIAGA
jgi:RNA polymerase sigma-70 factor (ECF subfamily)